MSDTQLIYVVMWTQLEFALTRRAQLTFFLSFFRLGVLSCEVFLRMAL